MEKKQIDFSAVEAAIALSTLVAFSDDNPSEEEGVILRKYYFLDDAERVQKKLSDAGYLYPNDLREAEPYILTALKEADKDFKLRTIAVAFLLSRADGEVDQDEMLVLSTYADKLEIGLHEAYLFSQQLVEVDENTGYEGPVGEIPPADIAIDLTPGEAGVALSAIIGFSDDDPSDVEAAVIKEFYSYEEAESLQNKVKGAGYSYPEGLYRVKPSILNALWNITHDDRLRHLSIAYKVVIADGKEDEREVDLIREFCEEYSIGLAELKDYFKAQNFG
jgi:tellurite resistance protein